MLCFEENYKFNMYSILVVSILLKQILGFRDIPAFIRLGREILVLRHSTPHALFNLRDITS